MARGRRPRWVRLGHDVRGADTSISRAVAHGDDATNGQGRSGQRLRRVGRYTRRVVRALDAALCAGRASSRRRRSPDRVHLRSMADVGVRGGRWHAGDAGDFRSIRLQRGGRGLDAGEIERSGRDYHSMHHQNGAFRFDAEHRGAIVMLRPYDGLPAVICLSNGDFRHSPEWYRQFVYTAERERGLDDTEDLGSPGEFSWPLSGPDQQAVWLLRADVTDALEIRMADEVVTLVNEARVAERRRRDAFPTPLDRAASAYLVRREPGRTIVAGYPWFTDWGRDAFIALRGLCLATGRLAEARDILVEWAGAVSEGMLPNRFPDHGEAAEFNSVDASLWYVVAVHELLQLAPSGSKLLTPEQRQALESAVKQIVSVYASGTRFGIRMDVDGLLSAGVPGLQLTWMDARVGDRVITPRIGKPVEIQALWLNALSAVSRLEPHWRTAFDRGRVAFLERFWNEDLGRLADVVDVDHVAGTRDDTFRPNQILAVGGLPVLLLEGDRARRIVDAVEQQLLTPIGLRSLAPGEPGYAPVYEGDSSARDAVD